MQEYTSCKSTLHTTADIFVPPANSIEAKLKPCTPPAIGQHLLQNSSCTQEYTERKFLTSPKNARPFIFPLLNTHTSKPKLCKQKKFVCSLKLSHWSLVSLDSFWPINASMPFSSFAPCVCVLFCLCLRYKSNHTSFLLILVYTLLIRVRQKTSR